MTRPPGPVYYVEAHPLREGRWRILRVDQGRSLGCVIADHYKRRCEAMTAATLLAGWSGTVVLIGKRRRAAA